MAEKTYPYTTVPGKLDEILSKAPTMGRPAKVTQDWLKQAGWTSSNDRSVIPVLRFAGIIAKDGTPTQLWDAVRVQDDQRRAQLAKAIRESYADLFSMYPDAHRRDAEALRNFFRAHTAGGDQVQTKLVQTFKVLTKFADFDASSDGSGSPTHGSARPDASEKPAEPAGKNSQGQALFASAPGLALNVNIQLQLPATADGEVYDKLFASMRKNLMGLTEG